MWKPIAFAIPDEFAYRPASGGSVLGLLQATPIIDEINPDADYSQGALGNGNYNRFVVPAFKHVVAHPWQQGIGQGNGIHRYLSPRNAVNTVANKLVDLPDDFRPMGNDYFDALSILLCAESYAAFSNQLSSFLSLFSDPTVYMCMRRSGQIASLEQQKTLLPDAALNSRWHSQGESNHASWNNFICAVGHADAFGFADDEGAKGLEEAVFLCSKKREALASSANLQAALTLATINGVHQGRTFFIKEQKINSIRKLLLDSDTGFEFPLSVCVFFIGAVDALNPLRKFFSA